MGSGKAQCRESHSRGYKNLKRQAVAKFALEYVELNILEAEGFISRKETKTLRELRAIWGDP